jgi:hypothetical protein
MADFVFNFRKFRIFFTFQVLVALIAQTHRQFASAEFSEVPLQWMMLRYTMYMLCIYYA